MSRRETYEDDPWGRDVVYDPSEGCDRDLGDEEPSTVSEATRQRVHALALGMLGAQSIAQALLACRPERYRKTG